MDEDRLRSTGGGVFASSPGAFFAKIASEHQPFLSYSEEFLWWSARLAGDATFNVRVVLRLRGAWRIDALARSVVEMARRHEALRTVFPMEKGVIVRRILPPASVRVGITDLEPMATGERDSEAWRLVLDEANRPFNLTRGPLFRSRIVRVGPDHHLLQFTIHHLVIDGRSVDIFLRELAVVYRAYCTDRESPLPALPLRYGDYAVRSKRLLRGATLDKALAYWTTQLAGIPSLLDLPADDLRRPARYYRGHTLKFAFGADRTSAILRLARQHGTTAFVFLLSILATLLSRLSGQSAVTVETPLANRSSLEAETLVGLLVELMVLRTDLAENPRLADLLSSVRRATLGAFDHAGVPIHVLVDAVHAHVDASHSALSQVMFNMIDMRPRAAHLQSLPAEQLTLPDSPHSKFDVMLTVHVKDTLEFQLLYRRDLFSESRMQEFVAQFTLLVEQVIAEPGKRIDEYSLVTPSAARVLSRSTAAVASDGCGCPIHARVQSLARTDPERTALIDGDDTIGYGELNRRSEAMARDLIARGIRRGDVVAVPSSPAVMLLSGLLATLHAGAACLVVDAADGADPAGNPDGLHVHAVVGSGSERAVSSAAGLDPGSVAWVRRDGPRRRTTYSHQDALSACAQWTTETCAIPPGARVGVLPGAPIAVWLQAAFAALWAGGTLCAPAGAPSTNDARASLEGAIAVAYGDPTTWRRVKKEGGPLLSLRHAFFVGGVLVREDVERVRALAPAATCASFFSCATRPQDTACYLIPPDTSEIRAVVPVGRGIAGVELLVLNRDRQLAGIGELGQMYFRRPSTDALTPSSDALVPTGLAGRFLPDGHVDRIGDASHWGTLRGYTIRFDEIVSVLMRHPRVLDARVALEAGADEVELVAHVRTDADDSSATDTLDEFSRHRLAAYLIPRHFVSLVDA
jgi:non-ribosomal peptide synthetase component F